MRSKERDRIRRCVYPIDLYLDCTGCGWILIFIGDAAFAASSYQMKISSFAVVRMKRGVKTFEQMMHKIKCGRLKLLGAG